MTHPRRNALGAALALTALVATAAPAGAGAATTGTTTIDLRGAAASALRAQRVTISAVRPAKAGAKRIVLPVAGGAVASDATLRNGGAVVLRARSGRRVRSAKLTSWRTLVAARRSSLSAKLGSKRITFFTVTAPARRVALDKSAGTARLSGGSVRLTPAGAKALRTKLGLRRLAAGPLGTAKVSASVGATRGPDGRGPQTGGGGGGGTTPTPPTDPGTPRVPPIASEPPLLARPATAVPITTARLTWWVRDSFVAYLYGGSTAPATGTTPSNGATAQAPIPSAQHICKDDPKDVPPLAYAFDFPFKNGWYDEASTVAGVYFTGTVAFAYRAHGIDMSASDPEIELNGAASRSIFRFDGTGNTRLGNKRAPLTNLDLARAQRTVDAATRTVTYGPILGTLAEGSASSFAGFYPAGAGFGCVQVSFTY